MALSVLVMAKAPRPGAVKTRLQPLLGADGCARLQAALIAVTSAWAAATAPGAAFLSYGPADAAEAELRAHAAPGVALLHDGEGDLGDRLTVATATVLARRPGPLLVVGTDMPTLGPVHADAARAAFGRGAEVVLGPAADGGYWLIGLRRPRPELFALGEAWGGPTVLERTAALAADAGLPVARLGVERDLDEPADVLALLAAGDAPGPVAAALAA